MNELIIDYINIDNMLISSIQKDDEKLIEELLERREKVISDIVKMKSNSIDLEGVYHENHLDELDKKVEEFFKLRMDSLKKEMVKLRKMNEANNIYTNSIRYENYFTKIR